MNPLVGVRQGAERRPAATTQKKTDTSMTSKRTEGFSEWALRLMRNRHAGEDCILMCNGPSLNRVDFSRIPPGRYVFFGLNKIHLGAAQLGVVPRYVAAVNKKVIEQASTEIRQSPSIKFVSNRVPEEVVPEGPKTMRINTAHLPAGAQRFSDEVESYIHEGWTVTHVALQLIYHLGFSRVFVVGMDHRFRQHKPGAENTESTIAGKDVDHFHPGYFGGGQKWDLPDLHESEKSYHAAKEAFEADGREIWDCTIDGACEVFPKLDVSYLYTASPTNSGERCQTTPQRNEIDLLQKHLEASADSVIVLYANSVQRVLTYVPLYETFTGKGYRCVLIIPYDKVDKEVVCDLGVNRQSVFSIAGADLPNLRNVKLLFASETLSARPPAGVSAVAIYHSLPDGAGLYDSYCRMLHGKPTIVRNFDYVILGVRLKGKDWDAEWHKRFSDKIFPKELIADRRPSLDIVPGGYPKIDYLKSYISRENRPKDCIIYSPTKSVLINRGEVYECGAEIIDRLRKGFPKYTLVVRPYPGDERGYEAIQELCDGDNVILDETSTGIEYQARAAVTVTDNSSSAVTFSLASRRPAVFCNFTGDVASTETVNGKRRRVVEKIGFRIFDIDELCATVDDVLKESEYWLTEIEKNAGEWICKYGGSAEYIARKIPVFVAGDSDAEFLSVERSPWMGSTEQEKKRYLDNLNKRWHAGNRFQESSLKAIKNVVDV